MDYEVVVGGSFAGLAVAAQLRRKRVLLLDHKPIGTGQTSACGTLVSVLRALDLEDAILQVHHRLVVHTPGRDFVYPVAEPFCTFDYQRLCDLLWQRSDAEFALAGARAVDRGVIQTSHGSVRGAAVVDASGWRAVLGSRLRPSIVRRERLNFGIETTVAYADDGLHFWYDPRGLLPMTVTWAFPIGRLARVGVGSYRGETRLESSLERFLGTLGLERNRVHGTYFPHTLREPVVGDLFLVGDAAGQCLGLTGEGIRPALFFGTHLGRLLRHVLDNSGALEDARSAYRHLVARYRRGYDLLCLAQRVLPHAPLRFVQALMAAIEQPTVLRRVLALYLGAF